MRLPLIASLLLGSATAATPQQNPSVFRSEATLVVLHVNVFDKHADPVPDLTRENFAIVENDRPQPISFFSGEDVPVTVGLVIDNSSSMITRHGMVVAGGMAFANSSHPEDQLFTVSFTENVRLGLPPSLRFTPSRPVLQGVLNSMQPGGKTALYDAVIRAIEHIEGAAHQKRVIIVLSDGEDTASTHSKAEMLTRAQRSDVIIYTIGVLNNGSDGNAGVLKQLARIGGGLAYFPETETEVIGDFETIARNVRQGYSIGYVPTDAGRDGALHQVKIVVRVPGRTLDARYRHAYTADRAPSQ